MTRKLLAIVLTLMLAVAAVPVRVLARQTVPATGLISGTARSQTGHVVANTTVRLRNLVNQQIVGTTTSNTAGGFTFTGLTPGQYMAEVVNAAGQVIGTSGAVTLTAASMIATGVGVTAVAAAAAGGFLGSTLGLLTLVGISTGVAGLTVAVTRKPVSPSQ